jgi:hypothetical protein
MMTLSPSILAAIQVTSSCLAFLDWRKPATATEASVSTCEPKAKPWRSTPTATRGCWVTLTASQTGTVYARVLAAKRLGIDLAAMPRLRAWCEHMVDRPAVQFALRAEGLTT